jgi:hypothetical protein
VRPMHNVHISASGHTVSIPDGASHSVDTKQLFIAHYIAKQRTYIIEDKRHEQEAEKRRRKVGRMCVCVCMYSCIHWSLHSEATLIYY